MNNKCVASARIFVTQDFQSANLGGTAGADKICQTAADAQSLGGKWKARASDSKSNPSTSFTHSKGAYRLLDGTLVARNWADLTDGTLTHAIDMSEQGNTLTNSEVWTNTSPSGAAATPNGCSGFTSNAASASIAEVGVLNAASSKWTHVYLQYCNRTNVRLYCFQQ